jgi:hypothetical protein
MSRNVENAFFKEQKCPYIRKALSWNGFGNIIWIYLKYSEKAFSPLRPSSTVKPDSLYL